MKNVLRNFAKGLSSRHAVQILDPRDVLKKTFWQQLRTFQPEIVHYLAGPTLSSLILLRLIKSRTFAKTVVSAIHPSFPLGTDLAIGACLPDLVLTISWRTTQLFARHRAYVFFLPFGVDTSRFVPSETTQKAAWRREFNLPAEPYLILHVGHIVRRRGIEALTRLQTGDQQVLVIGSVNTPPDEQLRHNLEARGVIVWTRYIPEIEKVYALADCYVFPTRDPLGAIEIPLSVLEAMSCNLPVIATPFGGLPDLFPAGGGVFYEDRWGRWSDRIAEARNCERPQNRVKVIPLGWDNVIVQLEQLYNQLVAQGKG